MCVRQWEFPQDASSNGEDHEIPWGLGFFSPNISEKTTHISWWYVTRHVVLQRRSNIHLDYAQDGENNVKHCKYWKYKNIKTWQYIFSALGWWWASRTYRQDNQSNPWAANQEWNQPDKWIKNRTHQVETQSSKQMHQHPRKYRSKAYNCSCSFVWCLKWKNTHPGPVTQQKNDLPAPSGIPSALEILRPEIHGSPPYGCAAPAADSFPLWQSTSAADARSESTWGHGFLKTLVFAGEPSKDTHVEPTFRLAKKWTNKQGTRTTDRFIYNKSGHVVGESLQSTTQMTGTPYD